MPEGHTIHRLARVLFETFGGRPVAASSPQGRFSAGAALVDGSTLTATDAHGKHLFLGFGAAPAWIHVHLGLIGMFDVSALDAGATPPPPAPTVRLRLAAPAGYADLRGAIVCEVVTDDDKAAIEARLGPDPLCDDADPGRVVTRLLASPRPVGALLMDQQVIAGVGNVYRAEVLFRAGLDPATPGRRLDAAVVTGLWDDLRLLMRAGVETGQIDTVRPEHEPEAMGRPPRVDDHGGEVYVYRRAGLPCLVCGTEVSTRVVEGRNLFWCATCQG